EISLAGFGIKAHQTNAIPVCRDTTVGADRLKFEASFIVGAPHHDGVTVFNAVLDLTPNVFPNSARVVADVNAGTDLQQPYGEAAAQSRRCVFKNDDQHHPTVPDSGWRV